MVAPVQGGVDPTTCEDYLNELSNFYADEANEGIEADFEAPNGDTLAITNASDVSAAKTSFNKGETSEVAEDADLSLEEDKEDKEVESKDKTEAIDEKDKSKTTESEDKTATTKSDDKTVTTESNDKTSTSTSKNGDKKEMTEEQKKANQAETTDKAAAKPEEEKTEEEKEAEEAQGKAAEEDKKAKDAEKQGENTGEITGESLKDGSSKAIAEATDAKADAEINNSKKLEANTKSTSKKNDENKKNLDKIVKNADKMVKTSLTKVAKTKKKLKAAIARKKQEKVQMQANSTEQSGPTMGFEGQLKTVKSDSSAGQASMENTLNGSVADKALTEGAKNMKGYQLKMKSPAIEAQKAAAPDLKNADKNHADASTASAASKDFKSNRNGLYAGAAVSAVAGLVLKVVGSGLNIGGTAILPPVVTAPAGAGMITAGTLCTLGGIVLILAGVALGYAGKVQNDKKKEEDGKVDTANEQAANFEESAEEKGVAARKQAKEYNAGLIAQQKSLDKTIKEMEKGLSTSEIDGAGLGEDASEDEIETAKADRESQIMDHEMAHAAISGGSPVIEYDANGVAIGGYVDIELPTIEENDLAGSIEKAQMVIEAALAPGDPSSQDMDIASQAEATLAEAQAKLEEKANKVEKDEEEDSEEINKDTDSKEIDVDSNTEVDETSDSDEVADSEEGEDDGETKEEKKEDVEEAE